MMSFLLCAAAITCIFLYLCLRPLWMSIAAEQQQADPLASHKANFTLRVQELAIERDQHRLDDDEYEREYAKLARELLALDKMHRPASQKKVWQFFIAGITVVLLMGAIYMFYQTSYQGEPIQFIEAQQQLKPKIDLWLSKQPLDPPPDELLTETQFPLLLRSLQYDVSRSHFTDRKKALALSTLLLDYSAAPERSLPINERLYQDHPQDPEIMLSLAQTRLTLNKNQLDTVSRHLLTELTTRYPEHEGASLIYAMALTTTGDQQAAIVQWKKLALKHNADSPMHSIIADMIARLEKPIKPTGIAVTIEMDPSLSVELPATAQLYLFASEAVGRPPIAVVRQQLTQLPMTLYLNDDNNMMPSAQKISQYSALKIAARISLTGDATAHQGDITAEAVTWTPDTQALTLRFNAIKD